MCTRPHEPKHKHSQTHAQVSLCLCRFRRRQQGSARQDSSTRRGTSRRSQTSPSDLAPVERSSSCTNKHSRSLSLSLSLSHDAVRNSRVQRRAGGEKSRQMWVYVLQCKRHPSRQSVHQLEAHLLQTNESSSTHTEARGKSVGKEREREGGHVTNSRRNDGHNWKALLFAFECLSTDTTEQTEQGKRKGESVSVSITRNSEKMRMRARERETARQAGVSQFAFQSCCCRRRRR